MPVWPASYVYHISKQQRCYSESRSHFLGVSSMFALLRANALDVAYINYSLCK